MTPRRYAGYKLAGLPLENVANKVKEAAEALKANATPMPTYTENIPVPGTKANVVMRAVPSSIGRQFDDSITGNPNEIQKIVDAQPPGILTLEWDVRRGSKGLNDKQRFAAARIAQKEFKRIFADIPNGTIVQNSPVGGLRGDYTRADAYMTQGMGPLQNDGVQYAIINNGTMEPISPFIPLEAHAEHLAKRAKVGGQLDVASAIEEELFYRKNYLPESSGQPTYYEADGPEYDEGPKVQEYNLEVKDELERELTENANRAEIFDRTPARRQMDDRGRRPLLPEIRQREEAKAFLRGRHDANEYIEIVGMPDPTPDQISEFRNEQVRHARQPNPLRDLSDQVEQVYQRPSPPVLSINDSGIILQDRRMTRRGDEFGGNLTENGRRDLLRHRAGSMFTGEQSGDRLSDPVWMREHAGRDVFTDQRGRHRRGPSESNRPNSPQMVEDMRAYQLIAEQADQYLEGPMSERTINRASTNPDIPQAVQMNPRRPHTQSEFFGNPMRTPDTSPPLIGPRVPPIQSREFPTSTPVTIRRPERPAAARRTELSAVDAIRNELGLRRSNGLVETDDIPF